MVTLTEKTDHEKTLSDQLWAVYYGLREKIETLDNIGKMIIIDPQSGDYEIGDTRGIDASQKLQDRHPKAKLHGLRIGYQAAVSFSGPLERLPV